MVQATFFVGERVEYSVKVEDQGVFSVHGLRRNPIDEGAKVWLKLQPEVTVSGLRIGIKTLKRESLSAARKVIGSCP